MAQKTILATAILHNMAAEWSEADCDGPDDQDDGSDEEETDDEEDGDPARGREEQDRAQGSRVREAMLQARFLSINSKAISVLTTAQHFFYFKFKKFF